MWVYFLVLLFAVIVYRLAKKHLWLIFGGAGDVPNPFKEPARKRKGISLETSQKDRDKVLKQSFSPDKIPPKLDGIVIGSGIGGLTVAAILSKVGKKILVLEQHDQAGGCCHTFVEKGFEFDVGIHYIGEMAEDSVTRVLVDQLTESGLEWQRLEEKYDTVILGLGEADETKRKRYSISSGRTQLIDSLVEKFPDEEKVIRKFFGILKQLRGSTTAMSLLKLLPLSVSRLLVSSGVILWLCPALSYYQRSLSDVLNELTDNKELKAVLAYSYGNYGSVPKEGSFGMQALLTNHFMYGGYYPVGGASEIAFHIIPTIEEAGGRVLVRARVTDILLDDNERVTGVQVKQGHTVYEILAPMVISDAGVFNTVKSLLPSKVVKKYGFKKSILSKARHGLALLSVFVGLDGTKEELNLKPSNTWAFRDANLDTAVEEYMQTKIEDVGKTPVPLMFLSFPSTKDPTFEQRYPGKSTCTIITVAPYKWFEHWKDEKPLHRSGDYEDFKNHIGEQLWSQAVDLYPQLEGRREYFEVGSPLTNIFYLGSERGEVYGADHNTTRFSLEAIANLRPDIGLPGLYLTGQDILVCGFTGAMFGGLLCAMQVLERNLMNDLISLTKRIKKDLKSKKD